MTSPNGEGNKVSWGVLQVSMAECFANFMSGQLEGLVERGG